MAWVTGDRRVAMAQPNDVAWRLGYENDRRRERRQKGLGMAALAICALIVVAGILHLTTVDRTSMWRWFTGLGMLGGAGIIVSSGSSGYSSVPWLVAAVAVVWMVIVPIRLAFGSALENPAQSVPVFLVGVAGLRAVVAAEAAISQAAPLRTRWLGAGLAGVAILGATASVWSLLSSVGVNVVFALVLGAAAGVGLAALLAAIGMLAAR